MSRNDAVEIAAEVLFETENAIKCDTGDPDPVWIPKSQIMEWSEVWGEGDSGVLVIPEWLALEKALI